MTPAQIAAAVGCTFQLAEKFTPHITEAVEAYGITTTKRLAAFLAQIGHESGGLRYTAEIWGPTPAQARYEGRADLGNSQPGDGKRYRGHGLIQITGRFNHAATRDRMRRRIGDVPDFEAEPEALEQPRWACLSAADFWDWKGLNTLADVGDFEGITRRINGGLNGYADRLARLKRATAALERNDQPFQEDTPMLPFVAAAVPALIQAAPSLIRIFGDSPQAEKNAKAAELVADIAKSATGETTVEGAVNAIQDNPEKAAAFREAVHLSMGELLTIAERVNAMDQANIAAARQYNTAEPLLLATPWVRLRFIHVLSLLFVGFSGWFVTRNWGSLTAELKGAVITLMVIAGWNGVRDYWMGSSSGSERKTDMLTSRSQQQP